MIYISNNSKASNTAFEHSTTVQKHMLRFVQGKHGYMSMQ